MLAIAILCVACAFLLKRPLEQKRIVSQLRDRGCSVHYDWQESKLRRSFSTAMGDQLRVVPSVNQSNTLTGNLYRLLSQRIVYAVAGRRVFEIETVNLLQRLPNLKTLVVYADWKEANVELEKHLPNVTIHYFFERPLDQNTAAIVDGERKLYGWLNE